MLGFDPASGPEVSGRVHLGLRLVIVISVHTAFGQPAGSWAGSMCLHCGGGVDCIFSKWLECNSRQL